MKSGIFRGLCIALIIFVAASCKKDEVGDEQREVEDLLDLPYGEHEKHTLDVYLPKGRTDTTRVIILLHGGSWAEGDKSDLTELATYLRDSSNFAVINMNYRLTGTPENIHPAQENDIHSAIKFISSKAFSWNINSNKYGLLGYSAGGHLALLYTYAYNTTNKVKTVASLSGPTNLDTRTVTDQQASAIEALMGASYQDSTALYIKASPLSRASSLSKPTLLIDIQESDTHSQTKALNEKLHLLGVKAELVDYPSGLPLFDTSNKKHILDTIELWFNENIN